ncbi:MAG: biotin--[acetyl-CoA-carboxylase] ligase [Chloroflexaceae bacterium]|nr:biotin--[acetyl-CoA-carboxylase] ligase [Chloroflexaceae bacterium]
MITPTDLLRDLPTRIVPRRVLSYGRVGSTMDIARQELQTATAESLPLLVLAEEQTTGRGRMGRQWVAPPESALMFSLAMRPRWLAPADAGVLVWLMGVALCEALQGMYGLEPRLKWPNDVLLDEHKLAGILPEASSSQHHIEWAIIGCGINISASPPPDGLRYPAIHLTEQTGGEVDRRALLRALLVRLDDWYTRLESDTATTRANLFDAWRGLLVTIGQRVQVETTSGMLAGLAEDVEPSGALRLRSDNGDLHTISSGDVFG